MRLEIKDQFYLNDEPLKILSGTVHYFRIHPTQWRMTLENLKRLGFNTVETYVAWNGHEPREGQFNFSGLYDLEGFVRTAQEVGLYVILRPTPYICAEWEFGGFPGWLLKYPDLRLRTNNARYLEKVQDYYDVLLPKLIPLQSTHGGPIIMMQLENEYGSFGEDKDYLHALRAMMLAGGIDVPLFTSDGTWPEALDSGTLIDDAVLVTGNFGSKAEVNFDALANFHQDHGQNWPLMCAEYWDGWFNRWGEPIVRRDTTGFADDVAALLKRGSINLYMFRGGTNFEFKNGTSVKAGVQKPQVTSYDYDAPLTEWGAPTAKYFAIQQLVHRLYPELPQAEPLQPPVAAYGTFAPTGYRSLFAAADRLPCVHSQYPQPFEELGSDYGYVLYRSRVKNYHHPEKLAIVEASDRVQIFIDRQHLATQTYTAVGAPLEFNGGTGSTVDLDILVENLGRVCYGAKLQAPTQSKGIRGGVMVDYQFRTEWDQVLLPFDAAMVAALTFAAPATATSQPHFTKFNVTLPAGAASTFIDCSAYGKGCIMVNGFNIGRFWKRGPIETLYVPGGLLKENNEIIVFESENVATTSLKFVAAPITNE